MALNTQLLFKEQVAVVTRRTFMQLCIVHQLHPYMDPDALYVATHALVISWLDY